LFNVNSLNTIIITFIFAKCSLYGNYCGENRFIHVRFDHLIIDKFVILPIL